MAEDSGQATNEILWPATEDLGSLISHQRGDGNILVDIGPMHADTLAD